MANEFKRMQKLAGLITESQLNENKSKLYAMLADVADEFGKDSDFYSDLESAVVGWSDRNGELTPKGKLAIKNLLSNWDLLDDYGHFLEDDMNEGSKKSNWTVGEEIIGGKKHYFLYDQETGKRKGMYKSKEEAKQNMNENESEFPYFEEWKKSIINHLQGNNHYGIDTNMFSKMTDPYDAIDYLVEKEFLYDNDLDRSTNINYIKTGEYTEDINEGDTDYDRAKDAKRLGKKGEKNIYGAGVKKGEEIEKKKMKMSELKKAIKALAEGEDDVNFNSDTSLYDPVAEAKKDKEVEDIKDVDVTVGDEETTADVTTAEVDPNVKAVQDALTQAQVAAEKLGDDKLTDQIGNTITFFTRTHIVDKPGMTAESNIKERISKLVKSLNESPLNEAKKIPQDLKNDLIASAEKDFPRNSFRSGHYVRQYLDPRDKNFKKLQKGIIKFGGKKGEITFKAPENSYFKNAEMTFEVNRDGRISYTVFAP